MNERAKAGNYWPRITTDIEIVCGNVMPAIKHARHLLSPTSPVPHLNQSPVTTSTLKLIIILLQQIDSLAGWKLCKSMWEQMRLGLRDCVGPLED